MSKITNDGLSWSGTGYFIALPYGNSGRQLKGLMMQSNANAGMPTKNNKNHQLHSNKHDINYQ